MLPASAGFGVVRSLVLMMITAATLAGHAWVAAQAAEPKQKVAAVAQKSFPAAEDAVQALVAAAKSGDSKALLEIFGPEARTLVYSGDAVADKGALERFANAYEEANKLDKSGDDRAILSVGKDAWPFPIPVVRAAAGWRFDTAAGREELVNRRIGRNELSVIQAALAYVDAQREYYLRNPQGDKLLSYAQRFVSTKGKRDGLYFVTKEGERESPLGPLFDAARAAGYSKGKGGGATPYLGYHFRILKGQGADAPGGAYDYVVAGGKMIGGFALVAWPASYGSSGVMTFIVNHDGVVYEKDLGPGTAAAAQKITRFNPDDSWRRVEPK